MKIKHTFSLRFLHRTLAAGLLGLACSAWSDTVTLTPAKDATIFEEGPDSAYGNGYLHVGKTTNGFLRRALIEFDISTHIPAGATIDSVTLTLTVVKTSGSYINGTSGELYRLDTEWSEGTSGYVDIDGIASGFPAGEGDCTWRAAEINTDASARLWTNEGGDYDATNPSASVNYDDFFLYVIEPAPVSWSGSPQMVSDVQGWLDDPASNHGWILDSEDDYSKLHFGSKESVLENASQLPPTLVIEYTPGAAGDGDLLDDDWEQAIVEDDDDDAITSIEEVLAEDDFNQDGISNLLAYAFGYGPLDIVSPAAGNGYPILVAAEDNYLLRFTTRNAAIDLGVIFTVETRDNLSPSHNWAKIAEYDANGWTFQSGASATETESTAETSTWELDPGAVGTEKFIRLNLLSQ